MKPIKEERNPIESLLRGNMRYSRSAQMDSSIRYEYISGQIQATVLLRSRPPLCTVVYRTLPFETVAEAVLQPLMLPFSHRYCTGLKRVLTEPEPFSNRFSTVPQPFSNRVSHRLGTVLRRFANRNSPCFTVLLPFPNRCPTVVATVPTTV